MHRHDNHTVDLIHYLLIHASYFISCSTHTHLLFANGARGVGIFNFQCLCRSYQVYNKVTQRVGLVCTLICSEPAVMHMNIQGPKNLYGSVIFHIQCPLAVSLNHRQVVSTGSTLECILCLIILILFPI